MEKFRQILKSLDMPLLSAVCILCIIGIFLVSSATASLVGGDTQVMIQAGSFIVGLICCLFLAFMDYEFLASKYLYIIGIDVFLLLLVLFIGTGAEEVGGNSWIRFGPIGIQPAEIVKIGFILSFGFQLDKYKERINDPKVVLCAFAHIAVLVALVMMQPDFGTTMVFVAIFLALIFVAKISWKYLVGLAGAVAVTIPVLWLFVFKDYQKNRILTFLNPELDTQMSGYQVMQSKTAVGAGQLFGQGPYKGILTQNNFLPAKHTDFIYAVACEEFGFLGGIIILALICFIVFRCFYIGYNAKDHLGAFISIGVGTMFLVQSFENIGMTIGLTPVTGITLPFLSYGGSSMVTNLIAIGLVLNVKMKNKNLSFI
ncbi:MAG: rod shape-determining protein RodA [Ruminococcaceae bacterium]|nr:rod shape-determining protein RodA [Oscillospiraceae bacterium]